MLYYSYSFDAQLFLLPYRVGTENTVILSRLRLKCDETRPETRFRLSTERTSPFKLAGASVQSTTSRRAVHVSLQGLYCSCEPVFCSHVTLTGYPLHSLVSPSLLPCVTVCNHISTWIYNSNRTKYQTRNDGKSRSNLWMSKITKKNPKHTSLNLIGTGCELSYCDMRAAGCAFAWRSHLTNLFFVLHSDVTSGDGLTSRFLTHWRHVFTSRPPAKRHIHVKIPGILNWIYKSYMIHASISSPTQKYTNFCITDCKKLQITAIGFSPFI